MEGKGKRGAAVVMVGLGGCYGGRVVVGSCYGGLVEACRSRVKGSWEVSFSSWVSNVHQSD